MRILSSLLAVPLVLGVAPAAQAAEPEAAFVMTVSRSSLAVSSLNTVPVTIKLTGSGTSGATYFVQFKRVAGTGPRDELFSMPLTEGPAGTWQGVVNVPSTVNGTIKAVGVAQGLWMHGVDVDAEPIDGPTVAVTGVHIPKIVTTFSPKVVPYNSPFSIKWTVLDSATGKPYGTRIKMVPREDNGCVEGPITGPLLSGTDGSLTKKYSAGDYVICNFLPGNPAPIFSAGAQPTRPGIVTATPSRTSAPVGTIVPVNGTAQAAYNCPVNLQRLYGATAWRTVGTAKVRASWRFTVNAQPAYKGNIPYRVLLPACNNVLSGVSKTFTIKGL
jgi:hypothetical protein